MMNFRIGQGYDVHALEQGLPLVLGGVRVEHHSGCVAHSDGDVLIHALCDALLGAAAMADIGAHFPDTDPLYKGADSVVLLERVVGLLAQRGYSIGNVDVTLVLERPKVRLLVDSMRERLAVAMGVDVDCVSVKASTSERLGFVGRQEGVVAHAVVLIYKE